MENYVTSIKNVIEESIFSAFGKKIEVRFVSDVEGEAAVLCKGTKLKSFISGDICTGMFIPWAGRESGYILIKYPQNNNLEINTAYHELRHCLDYCNFLKFYDNEETMSKSPLYITFNIYSEFNSIFYGYYNYFKLVTLTEDDYSVFLENVTDHYLNMVGIKNRFEYLNHALKYYALCKAIDTYHKNNKATQEFYNNTSQYGSIDDVIVCLTEFIFSYEWFEQFDKICREYIG